MRNRKLIHSVLAAGMAAALAAAPVSAMAETVDETELAAGLQEAVENTVDQLNDFAYEEKLNVVFGDGLYQTVSQNGGDASWLKSISESAKLVPGEGTLDVEFHAALNDTELGHVLVSYDPASSMIYFSAPEFFDQAVALNVQQFVQNIMSGSSSGSGDDALNGQIMQLFSGFATEIVGQVQELIASLPAELWQMEAMNYLTPVLNNLQQETVEEELTVGDLSATVQKQVFAIPSDKMKDVISGILDSMANDQVVETVLQSDAVSSISSLVSMVTGGSVQISGQDLLNRYQSAVGSAASVDVSGIPGIVAGYSKSADGRAVGFSLAFETGGQNYDLLSFKAIQDGDRNAFSFKPEATLLSMAGIQGVKEFEAAGEGSTEGGMLNETVDILVNGEKAGTVTVKDFDLIAAMEGATIGTLRMECGDMSIQITYNVEDDGTRTISYLINDEVFYDASAYVGPAEDTSIELIDKAGAVEIATVQDLLNWIGTFKAEELKNALTEAGIPMNDGAVQ